MLRATLCALTAALAALLTLAAPADGTPPRRVRLRAMTFNVRYDFPNDGDRRWGNRVDLVARTIQAAEPHVLCIQEDKEDQVADLQQRLEGYQFTGVGRNATGSGERNSIVWSTEHFTARQAGDFWLSDTPLEPGSNTWGDRYPRKVTWALLEPRRDDDTLLLVLNTHLPEGDRNDRLRERGVELIRDWLNGQLQGRAARRTAVLVCGDFNSDVDSDAYALLTEGAELRDAWVEAGVEERWPGTFHGFEGRTTTSRIDWVLVGGPARVLQAARVDYNEDGEYPSDHYPVIADLELR